MSDALQDYRATTMTVCLLSVHNDGYRVAAMAYTGKATP